MTTGISIDYDENEMAKKKKKKKKRIRTGRGGKGTDRERGPSIVFYIALILGLILLAWLGYVAMTTQVTPPSVPDLDYSSQ